MKISDKAQETPEIDLAKQSAPGAYRLADDELVEADEITEEGQFPKFGDFLPVKALRQTENGVETNGEMYIECPQALAQWLVENEIEIGEDFRVISNRKVDRNWEYTCERIEAEDV